MSVRVLRPDELEGAVPALAEVLVDAVASGAGVSFMASISHADARAYWRGLAGPVAAGTTLLFVAETDGRIEGTVQMIRPWAPNQPHRCDLSKLLVHRRARRQGHGRALVTAFEAEARGLGISVITFDAVTGSTADRFYQTLGFTRVGDIPDYAYLPDGRLGGTAIFYKRLAGVTPRSPAPPPSQGSPSSG